MMKVTLRRSVAVCFLLFSLLVAGCSTDIKQSDKQFNNEVEIKADDKAVDSTLTSSPTDFNNDKSVEIDDEATSKPIASLQEHDIYLYPSNSEDGVILKHKDITHKMDWIYTTPREVLPVLQLFDFDGDENEELAVILNIGSGTGVSIDELHIVEISKDISNNQQDFIDHKFHSNDYIKLVIEAINFKKLYKNDILFAEIDIANQTYEVSLHEFVEWAGEEKTEDRLVAGNIVNYEFVENEIIFTAAVGITIEDVFDPQYIGEIKAKVNYVNDDFSLTDYSFIAY